MLKFTKYILIVTLLLMSGVSLAYAHIVRSLFIDFADFINVRNNVYLSTQLSNEDRNEIESLLQNARSRIESHFGAVEAEPVVIVVAGNKEASDYGIDDKPGILFYAPWQNYLVLNYKKRSIDVTAHELVHAEVAHRLGYIKRVQQIPTWFDEGVALQVDYRPRYTLGNHQIDIKEITRVQLLDTANKFWTTDKELNVANYQAAKVSVRNLFERMEEKDLYSLLSRIRKGEEFSDIIQNTN